MTRPPRFDGHGNVRCSACTRYRPGDEFGWPPSLKGRPTSYCHGCQRILDRMRWRGERRARANAQRLIHQKRQQQGERQERIAVVQGAILTLRKRGLTKTDVARLADTTLQSLLFWERGDRAPTSAVVERFLIVLRETAHLPLGTEPAYRRRLPHPELDALLERCRPKVLAFPVRSRWKDVA